MQQENNMSVFNIEDYIKSLPKDTTYINVSYKSLTYLPSLKRFYRLKDLDCSNNQLTSLPELNDALRYLYCSYNQLTSLPQLNNKLQDLFCHNNQLTSLPELNNGIQHLCCSSNPLTSLPELKHGLRILNCSHTQLTSLPELNDALRYLDCSYNQLTSLPQLNINLKYLHCNNNQLISLPELNNKLEFLNCSNNLLLPPVIWFNNDLLNQEDRNRINNACQQLYRVKLLFWSLKYKAQFRHWLWVKVRLPKIEKAYHPSKLNELLNADMSEEELDNVLSNW